MSKNRLQTLASIALFVAVLMVFPIPFKLCNDATAQAADSSYFDYTLPGLEEGSAAGVQHASLCEPFFDDDPLTHEKPPMPKTMPRLDQAVLRACGPLRGVVTRQEFAALLSDHGELSDALLSLLAPLTEDMGRRDKLTQIWFRHHAFDHIFCGEWHSGSIGGLHLWARYAQLQLEGQACYQASTAEEFGPGGIYTIGVKSADGANRHPKKGFALSQDAADLLMLSTAAFVAYCSDTAHWRKNERFGAYNKSCLTPSDSGQGPIWNVVVCKADDPKKPLSYGLLTIYPDATPDRSIANCDGAAN